MTIVSAQTHLKAILDSLTGAGQTFSVAYDYPEPLPASFPAAVLFFASPSQEETTTSNQNSMTQSWIIRCIFKAAWNSTSYTAMLTMVDTVLVKLRREANRTSGTIYDVVVAPAIYVYYTDQTAGGMVVGDIYIDVKDLLSRT